MTNIQKYRTALKFVVRTFDNTFSRGVRGMKFNTGSNQSRFYCLSHILCYAAVLCAKKKDYIRVRKIFMQINFHFFIMISVNAKCRYTGPGIYIFFYFSQTLNAIRTFITLRVPSRLRSLREERKNVPCMSLIIY